MRFCFGTNLSRYFINTEAIIRLQKEWPGRIAVLLHSIYFRKHVKYICFSYHGSNGEMAQVVKIIPRGREEAAYHHTHVCWWIGDTRSQAICNHSNGQINPKYSGFSIKKVLNISTNEFITCAVLCFVGFIVIKVMSVAPFINMV